MEDNTRVNCLAVTFDPNEVNVHTDEEVKTEGRVALCNEWPEQPKQAQSQLILLFSRLPLISDHGPQQ